MQRDMDKSIWVGFAPSSRVALHKTQAGDETQPLGMFQSPRGKDTDEASNIISQFSLVSHPTSVVGNCFCCFQSTKPPSLPVPNSHVL